ncbi:maleylpyruvate isomerase family mycothiol-dependent enzyme [Streptomyces sp. NPDC087263]|uniref:maleylpyruvate isomerase family mycothiol-dependent enzyme n=1 Tax=Streptomyces sp. NPDC087263 TaxID=3365773 RepID=UPI0038299E5A
MDSASLLLHLRRELDGFRACLDGDSAARVEHCGDWTLYDLADHLGRGNLWAAAGVTEGHGDLRAAAAPREPAALGRWFDDTSETLLAALDTDPSTAAWTFFPPHTVGFWQRRRCMETLVHRWDAENALGAPGPLNTELVEDGVSEVFDTMALRMIARGRADPPTVALQLHATDTGSTWTYGPGDPVAVLSGTAENLLLTLWGRLPRTEDALTWEGDRQAGQRVLDGPLVP